MFAQEADGWKMKKFVPGGGGSRGAMPTNTVRLPRVPWGNQGFDSYDSTLLGSHHLIGFSGRRGGNEEEGGEALGPLPPRLRPDRNPPRMPPPIHYGQLTCPFVPPAHPPASDGRLLCQDACVEGGPICEGVASDKLTSRRPAAGARSS